MNNSGDNENKHKIFKYTDENGQVHYVDENGNPVKRRKPPSSDSTHSSHSENKIYKYTDKNGQVHYVDKDGKPVERHRQSSSSSSASSHAEHSESKRKIYKYTDKNGQVHYVDEDGNPVDRHKATSSASTHAEIGSASARHRTSSAAEGTEHRRSEASSRTSTTHAAAPPASTERRRTQPSDKTSKKKTKKKKKHRGLKIFFALLFILILAGIGLAVGAWISIVQSAPEINTSDIVPSNYTSIIYDDNGVEIDRLHGEENREYVTLDQIPEDLRNAVVAIEDQRFYEHSGIDIKGIFRALYIDIKERDFSQGASTITQQLIKNEILDSEKKITRKLQEQYLAVKYEKELEETLGSKEAAKNYILELYLNTISLNHGLNGVQAAAQYYFGKDVSELNLAECACIAGITKNPSQYSPISNPEANKERQITVLDKMLELEYITQAEYDEAVADDIYSRLVGQQTTDEDSVALHNYFVDNLIVTLANDLQEQRNLTSSEAYNLIYSGGLQIYSTMNQEIQETLEAAFDDDSLFPPSDTNYDATYTISVLNTETNEQEHHTETRTVSSEEAAEAFAEEIKAQYVDDTHTLVLDNLTVSNSLQAAMVIMDYHTGEIKALIGGRGTKSGDLVLNRATQSYRQPGSCFKVLAAYAPAIDQDLYSAGSFLLDEEYTVGDWTPNNWWSGGYRGYATVREGIRDSMNILAAKVIVSAGVYNSYNYLLNFGFTQITEDDINANTALGGLTNGVSVLELTAAYGAIANGGVYMSPTPYTKVLDHEGNVLLEYTDEGTRVIKETTAFLLTDMMEDVISGGGTGGLAKFQKNTMPVAGKTGTTSDDKDLVFAGYTPYYVAGIWMGYDTPKKISYDKSYHLIVWRTVMDELHNNLAYKSFEMPDGITTASYCAIQNAIPIDGVCSADYYGAGYYGSMVSTDYATAATVPTSTCTAHAMYKICTETGYLASESCPDDCVEEVSLAVVNGEIVNRPTEEECAENGKIYIDISQTCSLENHETSEMVPDDVVIGSESEYNPDSRFEGTQYETTTNNATTTTPSTSTDVDGQEFVIGAN
ncbi:MAG: penicillin-binding protein [Clostridiales bacterium]|nr:penicillin-binding protein [Clostridiales bacterium]